MLIRMSNDKQIHVPNETNASQAYIIYSN